MQLKKNEKRMLIFLGIIVVVFLIMQLKGKKDSSKSVPKTKNIASSVNGKRNESSTVASPEKEYIRIDYKEWGRNPFEDRSRTIEQTYVEIKSSLSLKGILWKKGKPFAIINDQILAEGESKGGIRVISISNNKVVCSTKGRTFTLEWKG